MGNLEKRGRDVNEIAYPPTLKTEENGGGVSVGILLKENCICISRDSVSPIFVGKEEEKTLGKGRGRHRELIRFL